MIDNILPDQRRQTALQKCIVQPAPLVTVERGEIFKQHGDCFDGNQSQRVLVQLSPRSDFIISILSRQKDSRFKFINSSQRTL